MQGEKQPRKTRSDKGQPKLNARDLVALQWIGEQYGVRLDQLQVLLGRATAARDDRSPYEPLSDTAARKVAKRWVDYDLARIWSKISGESPWVFLSRHGLRELGFSYAYWEADFDKIKHPFWVNEVRLYIERPGGRGKWISERAIKRQHRHALRIGGRVHYVDGEIERVDQEGETYLIGIEVERTPKSPGDLSEILTALVRSEIYEIVYYFTNQETRPGVERVLSRLPDHEKEKVRIFDLEEIRVSRKQPLFTQEGEQER
jgi:hypothetical protein